VAKCSRYQFIKFEELKKLKRRAKVVGMILVMLLVVFLFSVPTLAQEESGHNRQEPQAVQLEPETRPSTEEFGVKDYAYKWVSSADLFQRGLYGRGLSPGYGYVHRTGGDNYFTSTLDLPAGAVIKSMTLFYYDDNASFNIGWSLWMIPPDHTNAGYEMLFPYTSGTPGYGTMSVDPYHEASQLHVFDNYNIYSLSIYLPATDHSLSFKGVRIKYQRQISPEPLTASFTDVPTTHGFFRNIEALAASGITTGFSDGTYRPNEFVTRGQMAAFLSRALGLHHPDPSYP